MPKAILLKPLDGDPEGTEREFSKADFKALRALGAVRAAGDDDDDDLDARRSGATLTIDQLREQHKVELDRATEANSKLTDQVRDTCVRAEKAEAELAELRDAGAATASDLHSANERISELSAQLEAARAAAAPSQEGSEKVALEPENKMEPDASNKAGAAPKAKATKND